MQYSCELRESILSVEDIAVEYPMEQKANLSEDNGSFEDQTHFDQITLPLVEVDEIVLGTMAEFSVEVELLSFLENVELHHRTQQDNLDISCKDLLGSMKSDVSNLLSDYCISREFHESEFGSKENFPEMDLISMVEISQVHLNSAFAGILDCDSFLDGSIFQEFQILDVDSSQVFEDLFNTLKSDEPETCAWMFNEDMDFKNYNELIVSHELALVDDIFKSLPVPLLDHEKLRSLYVIIEEKLADLKPQPFSSLDEIYLDWHLLEEEKFSGTTYFDYENLLEDIDSPSTDFDWDSFGDGKIYDLVFSDDEAHELNVDEKMESEKLFTDVSMSADTIMVADSSKFSDNFLQAKDGEQLAKHDADRASLLLKSMSQFNDLDFFLNPQKATNRKNSDSVINALCNDAASTKIPPSNSFPSVSLGGKPHFSLAMNENTNKQKKLFNLLPMQDMSNMRSIKTANEVEAHSMPLPFPSKPFAEESEHIPQSMTSFPERVIIVNTQNLDKEMIVSRRSTYQRILAMEKEGAQVVERDSDLPVDVIISSAICLVWYDCRNIGKKATAPDEASSCLPLCIDNIATNVLTLLSFTFSGCILVISILNSLNYIYLYF